MAYTGNYTRIDIKSVSALKNGKYRFIASILRGITLEKSNSHIELDSWHILIDTQKTNYGVRRFFKCPYCFKNKKHLYHIKGSWKCRECGELKYKSTTTYRKGMEYCDLKIDKILDKLKVEHKIEYYTGDLIPNIKPYKMRWKTYNTLILQLRYWQCERIDRWLDYVSLKLKK